MKYWSLIACLFLMLSFAESSYGDEEGECVYWEHWGDHNCGNYCSSCLCSADTDSICAAYGPKECVYEVLDANSMPYYDMPDYPEYVFDPNWNQQEPKIIVVACEGMEPAQLEIDLTVDPVDCWYQ